MVRKYSQKAYFPNIASYRLDNTSLTIYISIITLKENFHVRELTIYKYNCDSSKSITSVSFWKILVFAI